MKSLRALYRKGTRRLCEALGVRKTARYLSRRERKEAMEVFGLNEGDVEAIVKKLGAKDARLLGRISRDNKEVFLGLYAQMTYSPEKMKKFPENIPMGLFLAEPDFLHLRTLGKKGESHAMWDRKKDMAWTASIVLDPKKVAFFGGLKILNHEVLAVKGGQAEAAKTQLRQLRKLTRGLRV